MLLITALFAGLFSVLAVLGAPPVAFASVGVFLFGVGAAQMLLFGGKRPQAAAILAGGVLCPAIAGTLFHLDLFWGWDDANPFHNVVKTTPQALVTLYYLTIAGFFVGGSAGWLLGILLGRARHQEAVGDENAPELPPEGSLWQRFVWRLDGRQPLMQPMRTKRSRARSWFVRRPILGALGLLAGLLALFGPAAICALLPWPLFCAWLVEVLFITYVVSGVQFIGFLIAAALVLMTVVAALGPAWMLRSVVVHPLFETSDAFPAVLFLSFVLGCLVVGAVGWLSRAIGGRFRKKRRRVARRLGFVAGLIVLLLDAALCVWLARVAQRPVQRAIAHFRGLGGGVGADVAWHWTVDYLALDGTTAGDEDLEFLECLDEVSGLTLRNTQVTDAGLKHIQHLQYLRYLSVAGTRVSDKGLESLRCLPNLTSLDLRRTEITGAGLESLTEAGCLSSLALADTTVDDRGLAAVGKMNAIENLDCADTLVTDAGLGHLAPLAYLRVLSLENCRITDVGLAHLAKLTSLEELNLSGTQVTDEGLRQLGSLKNLTLLDLDRTQVTDAGLRHLKGLKKLESVSAFDTKVTPAGAHALEAALPEAIVHCDRALPTMP